MGILESFLERSSETEDRKLYDFVRKKVEDSRALGSRTAFEANCLTNMAYLSGYSGVYWDAMGRQFFSNDNNRVGVLRNRIFVNRILPTVQNRLARLTKSRPKYQVRPNSNDQEDKDAARLAEKALDMIWYNQEISTKQIDLYMLIQQYGHSYLKVCYDATLGNLITNPETGEQEFEGDIRVDVVSALECFPDPLAKTLDECESFVQAKVRKLDYFKSHYPEKGSLVKQEDVWLISSQNEIKANQFNGTQGSGNSALAATKNCAIELCYYEKRSKKNPNGRMIICANGIVLEDKELPCGEIPFVKFDDIVVGGKYYSEAVITHLRSTQDQYNKLLQKRSQWINKTLAGKYVVARGSKLTQESLDNQSGEVLEYTVVPNAPPPSPLQVPVMPAHAYKEEESLLAAFNDVSGINEVSRGQSPGSGVTAAIALQYLSEQDDTRIGIESRRHELGFSKLGRIILKYIEEYYKTPRLLKIAGQNNTYQVKSFVGADIKGNSDVMVIEGSTLPGSTTAKRDLILTLYGQGLLGNPQNIKEREKVLKLLEFGDLPGLWEDFNIDLNQISESIEQIKEGILPEISEFDNNELHVYEKNQYRKSDQFKKLSPESQMLLLTDIEARVQLLTNQQNPQLAAKEQDLSLQAEQAQLAMNADQAALPNEEQLLAEETQNQQNLMGMEPI